MIADIPRDRLCELERCNADVQRELADCRQQIEALRQSEQRYVKMRAERDELLERLQTQIERMPIGYLLSDADLNYVHWNPAAEKVFGYRRDEVLGKHPFDVIVPPVSQEMVSDIFERLKTGDMEAHGTCENVTKDGRLITCEWSNTPLFKSDGSFAGLLSMVQEITERKRLEEQLQQAQKMEAIGRLAGGVAHDFNNLLTVITGFGSMLLATTPEEHPSRPALEQIRGAAERATALTRQLLTFSRRHVTAPVTLNLNTVVANMDKLLRRLIGEDINLQMSLASGGQVRADAGQMEQVLMNLVVNARDAMPQGGRVTVATADVTLDEQDLPCTLGLRPGPYVLLSVRDTGCGMDAATKARLFEPFFTTKESGKGTGLGLATVYGIIKQSGGHVEVESDPGHGSTFRIYLPRLQGPAPVAEPAPRSEPAPRGSETVLLVEDEELVRSLVRSVLHQQGYQVLVARNGAEGMRICTEYVGPIHLVITDVIMPEMSGRELLRQASAVRPEARFLFISGYTGSALGHQGLPCDSTLFLQKPFTPASLATRVRQVLDQ